MTPNDPRPPYVQVADDLRRAIAAGRPGPGERLKSGKELAKEYGVATMTVQRALGVLATEGMVVSYGNRGTFVRGPDDVADHGSRRSTLADLSEQVRALRDTVQALEGRVSRLERPRSGRSRA